MIQNDTTTEGFNESTCTPADTARLHYLLEVCAAMAAMARADREPANCPSAQLARRVIQKRLDLLTRRGHELASRGSNVNAEAAQ